VLSRSSGGPPPRPRYYERMAIGRVSQEEVQAAVEALRNGELVAFPTETVYGLGANANNPEAVRKIFSVKGRPSTHPVIVHIDHPRYLQRWIIELSPDAKKLADAFWPGPLTLVGRRAPAVNDVITGGQDTVAIRVPNHPVAQQLLNAFGGGIAAPSANRYGNVSPTRAEHVREEFGDEVKFVLDGGDCKLGVESTIVACVGDTLRVLRPGSVSLTQMRAIVPSIQSGPNPAAPRVPGTTTRHYSPATTVNVIPSRRLEQVTNECTANFEKVAVLALRPPTSASPYMTWINAGIRPDVYARQLYANLRTLDKAAAKLILVEEVPEGERWDAVRDRLKRAATAENIVTYDQDIAAWVADFGDESEML
jgi:L-threonylcarbamoyladenylate synthase